MAQKYYVVWKGFQSGIFNTWEACKSAIDGYQNAVYKSFPSLSEAERAFTDKQFMTRKFARPTIPVSADYNLESIAVDAACSGNPGDMEYRGVYVKNGQELFRVGPYKQGTNNIGEFLAIVHGLAFLKQRNSNLPLYTDSVTALSWIRKKKCNSKLIETSHNSDIFDLIYRAEQWLATNSYTTRIMKWETAQWGEIPADFGRKK
ncbi:MAG: ribonuclease H family protein [Bacteroidales bacterium]|jgi:ribonuclease HI|nr:ribonuclease H family protein [Bacteroidales bacterium]